MPEYPENTVWMIECRYWPDNQNADMPGDWTNYAPVEATGFGSGVVVRLEQLSPEKKPFNPPQIKNYLLTCGHVLRTGGDGFGPISKEIIVWKNSYGYHRTLAYNVKENTGRLKNQMEGGYLAHISPLSPYGGRGEAILEAEQKSHLDWALLEVTDADHRPSFETEPHVRIGAKAVKSAQCKIVGYPDGAGWEKDRNTWKVGGNYLANSSPVESFTSEIQTIDKEEGDFLKYRGAVEARAGMSGGGVFVVGEDALIGIHRSRHDPSLKAEALSFAAILDWLYEHRHVRPASSIGPNDTSSPLKSEVTPLVRTTNHKIIEGLALLFAFVVTAIALWICGRGIDPLSDFKKWLDFLSPSLLGVGVTIFAVKLLSECFKLRPPRGLIEAIPAGLIAGLLGGVVGYGAMDWYPFSDALVLHDSASIDARPHWVRIVLTLVFSIPIACIVGLGCDLIHADRDLSLRKNIGIVLAVASAFLIVLGMTVFSFVPLTNIRGITFSNLLLLHEIFLIVHPLVISQSLYWTIRKTLVRYIWIALVIIVTRILSFSVHTIDSHSLEWAQFLKIVPYDAESVTYWERVYLGEGGHEASFVMAVTVVLLCLWTVIAYALFFLDHPPAKKMDAIFKVR